MYNDLLKSCSKWSRAHEMLIANIKSHNFTPDQYNVKYTVRGKIVPLPAYIPYIGKHYFESNPRILCFAINQNLSMHRKWTDEWLLEWSKDDLIAWDRLNYAYYNNKPIPIKPYSEGFIPLSALIALKKWTGTNGGNIPNKIDDVIAVTNFIKFSTHSDANSTSIPKEWWDECGKRYVSKEIEVLKPDIILAFGRKTTDEIIKIVDEHNFNAIVINCRFPSRIASDKGSPLNRKEMTHWNQYYQPLIARINFISNEYHNNRADKFKSYFLNISKMVVEQIG